MTYTVSSEAARQAYDRAEEQIRDDMRAGAISDYIDADAAQEYLGTLIRLHQLPRTLSESTAEWIERVDASLDLEIQKIIETAVENNVHRVAGEL